MKRILTIVSVLLAVILALPAGGLASEKLDPAWLNILLVGTDSRSNLQQDGRADTIIVASVNKETGSIRLTSLARDMWIKLPGSDVQNKLNTAFRFGGSDMMMEAVNDMLGLNITDYVAVNFYGFCDLIDQLGGVDVSITSAEAGYINSHVENKYGETATSRLRREDGVQTLNGVQALAYARIRGLDNDFGRSQRQRNLIAAAVQKLKSAGLLNQMSLIKECFEYVDTNIGLMDAIALAKVVIDKGVSDIKQIGLPSEGNFRYGSGKSKLIFDAEATRQEALEFIYGK